ncbi:Phosphoglycolate phosphatase-like protein [Dinothrombium tinctorium]|uniref:Phosphoglycolate phosphatase-like protein n=1 Tax=Dinothrombium tinctorium TaxID=1965070 RepID=A0A3S3SI28_9ACAR|nr:Phosphoglycolate phosphatase-like protein [Dinothrombium tinctorium]RWS15567.1 Phosphoglycolate phosphatase-like protein [Dinothrombium tinctorium]
MNRKNKLNPLAINNSKRAVEFIDSFDYILCDCDGVLWVNNSAVPGVPQALNKFRRLGKKIIFATNNSTKTREEFMNKLRKLGYIAYMDELFPTSYSTAVYLKSIDFEGKAFILGSSGLAKELNKVGIESIGIGPDLTPNHWNPGMAEFELDPDVRAVIIGFDNQLSFPKLAKACSYLKRRDCLFIASNLDETYPSPEPGVVVPGPGAYVAAIEAVVDKKPIVLGKPGTFFFKCIRHIHPDIDPKRTVMIGDRLTTDMVFGHNNGLKTLHVQSGLGSFEEMVGFMKSPQPEHHQCVPDYYANSLAQFLQFL